MGVIFRLQQTELGHLQQTNFNRGPWKPSRLHGRLRSWRAHGLANIRGYSEAQNFFVSDFNKPSYLLRLQGDYILGLKESGKPTGVCFIA